MNPFRILLLPAFALLLFSLLENASAQEKKKSPAAALPGAVGAAFHKAYPNAKITGTGREKEKGALLYEVESMDGAVRRDLLYRKDGSVVEIEEAIAPGDLPDAVKQSLAKEIPGAKILKAEKTTRGSSVGYELSAESGGKKYSVAFDGNGKLLEKESLKGGGKEEKKGKHEKDDDDDD